MFYFYVIYNVSLHTILQNTLFSSNSEEGKNILETSSSLSNKIQGNHLAGFFPSSVLYFELSLFLKGKWAQQVTEWWQLPTRSSFLKNHELLKACWLPSQAFCCLPPICRPNPALPRISKWSSVPRRARRHTTQLILKDVFTCSVFLFQRWTRGSG